MKTEKFIIRVLRDGEPQFFPVLVSRQERDICVCVNINGRDVHFAPDEHDGLRPAAAECDLDPELLYQVGRAIRQQWPG